MAKIRTLFIRLQPSSPSPHTPFHGPNSSRARPVFQVPSRRRPLYSHVIGHTGPLTITNIWRTETQQGGSIGDCQLAGRWVSWARLGWVGWLAGWLATYGLAATHSTHWVRMQYRIKLQAVALLAQKSA